MSRERSHLTGASTSAAVDRVGTHVSVISSRSGEGYLTAFVLDGARWNAPIWLRLSCQGTRQDGC